MNSECTGIVKRREKLAEDTSSYYLQLLHTYLRLTLFLSNAQKQCTHCPHKSQSTQKMVVAIEQGGSFWSHMAHRISSSSLSESLNLAGSCLVRNGRLLAVLLHGADSSGTGSTVVVPSSSTVAVSSPPTSSRARVFRPSPLGICRFREGARLLAGCFPFSSLFRCRSSLRLFFSSSFSFFFLSSSFSHS